VSRTGKPLVFVRESEEAWTRAWNVMNANKDVRKPLVDTKSILAIPIFSPGEHVSMVVYADSEELEFWKPTGDSSPLSVLLKAIEGFVSSCDDMVARKVISFETSAFDGLNAKVTKTDQKILSDYQRKGLLDLEESVRAPLLTSKNYLHRDCVLNERTPEPLELIQEAQVANRPRRSSSV